MKENNDFISFPYWHESIYPMDIPIQKIQVFSPDSMKYFVSYKEINKTIKDINLSFINKNRYQEESISGTSFNVNLYTPDTLVNEKSFQQKKADLQCYMNKLSYYLSVRKQKKATANIIYINWRSDEDRRSFGRAMGNHILCDINFEAKELLHELIHVLLPFEVKQFSKGEYFIKESIIEWLALFLSNKTIHAETLTPKDSKSIYDIQINHHASWDLIYVTGPSIIQQIAAQCGEEKMANAIVSFCMKNGPEITSYDEFITHLNKQLSNDWGNKLDYLVKNTF